VKGSMNRTITMAMKTNMLTKSKDVYQKYTAAHAKSWNHICAGRHWQNNDFSSYFLFHLIRLEAERQIKQEWKALWIYSEPSWQFPCSQFVHMTKYSYMKILFGIKNSLVDNCVTFCFCKSINIWWTLCIVVQSLAFLTALYWVS
jgi:hypothetical protein